ncbi:MAG: hypothetical protein Q6M04_14295 [Thermostichus sp. BF3_bins_97]
MKRFLRLSQQIREQGARTTQEALPSVVPELDFHLQGRFRPFGSSTVASMTRAIATQMGSHRVRMDVTPQPDPAHAL